MKRQTTKFIEKMFEMETCDKCFRKWDEDERNDTHMANECASCNDKVCLSCDEDLHLRDLLGRCIDCVDHNHPVDICCPNPDCLADLVIYGQGNRVYCDVETKKEVKHLLTWPWGINDDNCSECSRNLTKNDDEKHVCFACRDAFCDLHAMDFDFYSRCPNCVDQLRPSTVQCPNCAVGIQLGVDVIANMYSWHDMDLVSEVQLVQN